MYGQNLEKNFRGQNNKMVLHMVCMYIVSMLVFRTAKSSLDDIILHQDNKCMLNAIKLVTFLTLFFLTFYPRF